MISIIVSTYNRPDALRLVLLALAQQDAGGFEVIIADDGSTEETQQAIELLKPKVDYSIRHVWHEHDGFRVAIIRNKSAAVARGDYLIFLDGDSVPRTSFVKKHQELAEHNYFVVGNRVLLYSRFTESVFLQSIPLHRWGVWQWFKEFCLGHVNRFLPILPMGNFFPHYLRCTKWQGAKTCNLGVWKSDFFFNQWF